MRRLARPLMALALALALCAGPRLAAASAKVAVLPFSGPAGATARAGLLAGMGRSVTAIPADEVLEAAADLGVASGSDRWLVALCARLGCQAVIAGAVERSRGQHEVVVTLYSGRTAKELGQHAIRVRSARLLGVVGKALGRQCLTTMTRSGEADGASAPAPAQAPPVAAQAQAAAAPAQAAAAPAQAPPMDIDEALRKHPVSIVRHDLPPRERGSIVDVAIGFGLTRRDHVLHSAEDSTRPDKTAAGIYPEINLRVDVYPLVPFVRGLLSGVGLGLTYAHNLGASASVEDAGGEPVEAASQELLLDLKWRWRVVSRPWSPTLTALAGWGTRDLALGDNDLLTSLGYRFFRLGLDGAVPLGTPYANLVVGLDWRAVTRVGNEAVDSYGSRTGSGGYAVRIGGAGAHRTAWGELRYHCTFEYLSFSTDFAGLDIDQLRRDERRDRSDSTTADDRLVRFWLGAGYAY